MAIGLSVVLAACWNGTPGPGADVEYPAVVAVEFPAAPAGDVALQLTLVDPDERPADLLVEVSPDGRTWRRARLGAGVGTTNLPTSTAGTVTTITWDSLADVGFRDAPDARLRFTASTDGVAGSVTETAVPALANLRAAALLVQHPMIHYGPFDAATIELAKQHDLVVIHPASGAVQPQTVREIQLGVDPFDPIDDVLVLAYISVGEDLRTVGMTDAQMLADPRFVGDASGPRIDPRGPNADGGPLVGIDPLGIVTNAPGGPRFASWYLDDNSVDNSPSDIGDGLPDRNAGFGGCFVNAGDPAWFEALDAMTIDGVDGQAGMKELLTLDTGRGYGCDGLFFDTFDTCAPNFYTDGSSYNQSEFEWTAPGFAAFTERCKARYPDKLALQNRGLFFFDPRLPQYAVTTRAHVDLVLVESYRLDSNAHEGFNAYFTADNKHNYAPKLIAEAGRPDGFRILSLGYAEGPGIDHGTLLGTSTNGLATLVEDVAEAQLIAGFAHYLTDAGVALANRFAMDQVTADESAPIWSSTYNDNIQPWPTPHGAPTPRPGLQSVVAGDGSVTVHWDVAQDQSGASYALYLQDGPFDFLADPTLAGARRVVLTPELGDGYVNGVGPTVYPFQATVAGLPNGVQQHLCLRAFDPLGHEEGNRVVLTATPEKPPQITIDGSFADWAAVPLLLTDGDDVPDSAGPDWLEVAMHHDNDNVYVRFTSANSFNLDGSPTYAYSRSLIFFDLDENAATGWPIGGIGSDVVLAGDVLYAQSSSSFNTGTLGAVAAAPVLAVTECEMALPWTMLDAVVPGARKLRVVCVNDEVFDYAPGAGYVEYDAPR